MYVRMAALDVCHCIAEARGVGLQALVVVGQINPRLI